jgi:hypothetical protein
MGSKNVDSHDPRALEEGQRVYQLSVFWTNQASLVFCLASELSGGRLRRRLNGRWLSHIEFRCILALLLDLIQECRSQHSTGVSNYG